MDDNTKQTIESMKESLLLTDSRLGAFLVYKNDTVVSRAIDMYGEYCQAEVNIMKDYLPNENCQYVDIGTNIGYHLVSVHKETKCNVLGFEPNPKHFAVASYNSKDYPKIKLLNAGASNKVSEIPLQDFDPAENDNFGSTHITEGEGTMVKVLPLDSLSLDKCDVIKIDVEGHEFEVFEGSTETINKYRPIIFYEAMDFDVWNKCHDVLSEIKYKQYWVACKTKPVGPTFKPTKEDPWNDSTVCNILAVPTEKKQPDHLLEVRPGEDWQTFFNRCKKIRILF
jgi:FkbM family methyltransferase